MVGGQLYTQIQGRYERYCSYWHLCLILFGVILGVYPIKGLLLTVRVMMQTSFLYIEVFLEPLKMTFVEVCRNTAAIKHIMFLVRDLFIIVL